MVLMFVSAYKVTKNRGHNKEKFSLFKPGQSNFFLLRQGCGTLWVWQRDFPEKPISLLLLLLLSLLFFCVTFLFFFPPAP
jgi:hypothetical protein